MHGYKSPINCTRTRTVTVEELTEEEARVRAQAAEETQCSQAFEQARFHIIRNARMENVGKSQSCMISKLRIIWKQAPDWEK